MAHTLIHRHRFGHAGNFAAVSAFLVLVAAGFLSSLARAADQPEAQPSGAARDPVGARAAYERGAAAFHDKRYDEAIAHFEEAYGHDPVGAFLLNIAQAYRLKTPPDCSAALRHYELFLAAEPLAPERTEVRDNVRQMNACVKRQEREQQRQRQGEQEQRRGQGEEAGARPAAAASSVPIWLAGAGATLALAGGVTYGVARAKWNSLEPGCCSDDTIDRWQTITNVSYGLMAMGGAAATAGLGWWLWGRPAAAGAADDTALHLDVPVVVVRAGGAAFAWGGRF